jgi:hypothetical protein
VRLDLLEERRRLPESALAAPQLGQPHDALGRLTRTGRQQLLVGLRQFGLGVRPSALPDQHPGVVGAADPEQVAHLEAFGEPLHLLAPLRGTLVVANPLAAKDQVAAAPADGDGRL